jgi:hypothetical protein
MDESLFTVIGTGRSASVAGLARRPQRSHHAAAMTGALGRRPWPRLGWCKEI